MGHGGDLEVIAEVVRELADEVDWVFFGFCPDAFASLCARIPSGVEIERYPAYLASLDLDLALAPLEQNRFNECKNNLRLLEYGVLGFPVICSDVLCYRDSLPGHAGEEPFQGLAGGDPARTWPMQTPTPRPARSCARRCAATGCSKARISRHGRQPGCRTESVFFSNEAGGASHRPLSCPACPVAREG